MLSYGSIIQCPACDTRHVVNAGEINARQQIAFFCSHCGWQISVEQDGSGATAIRPRPTQADHLARKGPG
jgi:hypothetical protein